MQPRTLRSVASPAGVAAAAVTFLLLVLFSPVVGAPFWSPRVPVLLALAATAPLLLFVLWRSGSGLAVGAAAAFLAVATVSTLVAPDVVAATTGLYGWGTGLLFVAAVVGAWALGRSTVPGDGPLLVRAFTAGVLLNAGVAVLQTALDLGITELELFDGRAGGLVGNPVQLGAVAVAGFAVAAWHAGGVGLAGRPWTWLAAAVVTAAAVELSGSRFALGTAVLVVVGHAALRRFGAAALLAVALAAGVALGSAIAATGGGPDAAPGTERVIADAGSGVTPRVETWLGAWHAVGDRPLLGAGPGRFRAATSQYRTLELARSQGADTLFVDAHNVFVEYAVTTGVLGVAALAVWLVLALAGAGGPLLHASLALFALHLVQPQGVEVTPLAFLALGAAVPSASSVVLGARLKVAVAGVAVVGIAAGATLLYADFRLDQAALDFDLADADAADDLMAWWPEPADMQARIHAFEWITTRNAEALESARDRAERAARRDGTNPLRWNRLGEIELRLGSATAARQRFTVALEQDPWSVRAMMGYARSSIALGRLHDAEHVLARVLLVRPDDEAAEEMISDLRQGA